MQNRFAGYETPSKLKYDMIDEMKANISIM